jgi:hypothetical protein
VGSVIPRTTSAGCSPRLSRLAPAARTSCWASPSPTKWAAASRRPSRSWQRDSTTRSSSRSRWPRRAEPYADAELRAAIVATVEDLDHQPLAKLMTLLERVQPREAYPSALPAPTVRRLPGRSIRSARSEPPPCREASELRPLSEWPSAREGPPQRSQSRAASASTPRARARRACRCQSPPRP